MLAQFCFSGGETTFGVAFYTESGSFNLFWKSNLSRHVFSESIKHICMTYLWHLFVYFTTKDTQSIISYFFTVTTFFIYELQEEVDDGGKDETETRLENENEWGRRRLTRDWRGKRRMRRVEKRVR